ncbi:adenylate/guanylate cyclase domain-containing protein [Candidatus Harpocratesius sp.]
MVSTRDLENKVKDYLSGDYEITEIDYVPNINNVSIHKKAIKVKMVTFCIDLRDSSELLFIHQKQTAGKIHKTFLLIVAECIKDYGGRIRDFQGDSILAFWPGKLQKDIENAVQCAMKITWYLDIRFSKYFEKYSKLDFGIGLDIGDVYVIRAGLSDKNDNNDLVYIGKSVNFAVAIANQAKNPYHLEISMDIYNRLSKNCIYDNKNTNMWKSEIIIWKNRRYDTAITKYYLPEKD